MKVEGARPDPDRLLASLKDFQRSTVEYVHRRFFLDDEPTDRFLVADEVGLGKTLIARGVTALALDHLWEDTERLDVVYVCSNAEIAGQNLKRLRVNDDDYAEPTRLTLLPRQIHGLRQRKLNFVSLTPGTSFDPHSAMGKTEERAVLYLMLRERWELGTRKGPRNLLCGGASRGRFEEWVDWFDSLDDIDADLEADFVEALAENERASAAAESLRERFAALVEGPFRRRHRWDVDAEAQREQRDLIGELRALLARTCIEALEPDLIILDEFQRFKHLLNEQSEAGELANELFGYRDEKTKEKAKTLLLSATPYKAYSTSAELEDAGHYEDFLATVDFLLEDRSERHSLEEDLAAFRRLVLRWDEGSLGSLAAVKQRIEGRLRGTIARTERLASSGDRNGMLLEVASERVTLEARDLADYVLAQRVAEQAESHDPVEFWKSAPYLLNLMDDYKLKRDFRGLVGSRSHQGGAVRQAIADRADSLLSWPDIAAYRRLDPGNARMRALVSDLLDGEAWRLLWLAPSLPYYEPAGAFESESARRLTKRLVFSSWAVVPKAISIVLSYEAERRMMLAHDPETRNSPEARRNRGSLLRVTEDEGGRLTGMPVLAMIYPSFALAEAIDPASLTGELGKTPSAADALDLVADLLAAEVDSLTEATADSPNPDERWYWAAPLLLDARRDESAAAAFLDRPDLKKLSRVDSEEGHSGAWAAHLERAEMASQSSLDPPLGRPPADLHRVLAHLALAAPGVASLRAISRGAGALGLQRDPETRVQAMSIGWAFRTLFNAPEVSELIRSEGRDGSYWQQVLGYCLDGCLQAVLDEYAHVEREYLGHVGVPTTTEVIEDVAAGMVDALSIRTSRANVDVIEVGEQVEIRTERMRNRFALRFGEQQAEDGATLARAENVRTAFNSPFWPFLLASTSVGQEGLDFHLYCHALVHWNLPSNPVDLEQREGRVHRYKGHAIRRNLARAHGDAVLADASADPWAALFLRGEEDRPAGQSELWPYWIYPGGDNGDAGGDPWARIERHVLALPLSRDLVRLGELLRSLTLYRSVLGQARQEDLVRLISERVPVEEHERVAELMRIDLSPAGR